MPRTLLACLVCLIPAVALSLNVTGDSGAGASGALDEILSTWERTQRDIKSLLVEFRIDATVKTYATDSLLQTSDTTFGVFRFVRTPDGDLRASCDLTPAIAGQAKFTVGLLDRRTVYFLNYKEKTELRIKLGGADLIDCLTSYFNPLALLLDRKRAEQAYNFEVRADRTYLVVKPKPAQDLPGNSRSHNFSQAAVAWDNVDLRDRPKGMPCLLWFPRNSEASSDSSYVINSWRMNAADGPTVEDLDREVNLPGWTILEYDLPLTLRKLFGSQQNVRKTNP